MSVLNVKPEFLYPTSRQFPFDEIADKIVRALEKRNWKVPKITVEFYSYGSGEEKYKMVNKIIGEDFKLRFSRYQARLSDEYNNIAGLSDLYIPKQIIEVYSDESGPSYYLYVGSDWDNDKEWFMNSIKVHSRLNNEPRRYLKYKGNTYNTRAKTLVHDIDLGREYSPTEDEPQSFNLEEKFEEFKTWLEKNVLDYILSFPEQELEEEKLELIPYEGPWLIVYSVCNDNDRIRINKGKENVKELPLHSRHASFGRGHRLVPLSCKGNYPKIANEGFIWCDVNQALTSNSTRKELDICVENAMYSLFDENYLIAIKPKYANDVYVADNSKFEETRQELFKKIEPRQRLTDEELDMALAARGATIVPLTEYKGDYKEPIVLIARELDFDEIEWIAEEM